MRSATSCYVDLAQFAVPVQNGGWLIHFLSDQQWILHWLLYILPPSTEAVLASVLPLGFEDEDCPPRGSAFDPRGANSYICAGSFSEFLYRYRLENEIWYALQSEGPEVKALTDEQRTYLSHYADSETGPTRYGEG